MLQARESSIVHCGPVFDVEVMRLTLPDGSTVQRDVVRHPGAVVILPITQDRQIIFIRNQRVAVNERLLELPAGKLESDESAESAAHRELIEETGYRAQSIVPLGEFYSSPGFTDERMHAFAASGLQSAGQQLEPGEDIEVEMHDIDAVAAMIRNGVIRDGKTIAAIALWREHGEPLTP